MPDRWMGRKKRGKGYEGGDLGNENIALWSQRE